MNQEKFINAYIELMSATLTEALQKNLVLQAQNKIAEEEISISEKIAADANESIKALAAKKDQEIGALKGELNDARKNVVISSNERDEFKKTNQHIDTFKTELLKSRSEITKLNELLMAKDATITSLQVENDNLVNAVTQTSATNVKKVSKKKTTPLFVYELPQEIIKDAGSF
jgi:predicted RNase H-like nuclease (RuvC/YqgF family)